MVGYSSTIYFVSRQPIIEGNWSAGLVADCVPVRTRCFVGILTIRSLHVTPCTPQVYQAECHKHCLADFKTASTLRLSRTRANLRPPNIVCDSKFCRHSVSMKRYRLNLEDIHPHSRMRHPRRVQRPAGRHELLHNPPWCHGLQSRNKPNT